MKIITFILLAIVASTCTSIGNNLKHALEGQSQEAPLKKGETCFHSTPEFIDGQKKCESGLTCKRPDVPKGTTGVRYTCEPDEVIVGADNSSLTPLGIGETCYQSTPKFIKGKLNCAAGLSCQIPNKSGQQLMGAAWKCLPSIDNIGGDGSSMGPAHEGEVCNKPSINNWSGKRVCQPGLKCQADPSNNLPGADHICRSLIIGGDGSSMGPAPEGEVCNKPSVDNWSGKRTCQKGLVCEADPSDNLPGADHICRRPTVLRGGPTHLGGDPNAQTPAFEGEVCDQPSVHISPLKRKCYADLECVPNPEDVKKRYTGGNHICLPKKSAITNIGGDASSLGPARKGEVCNKPSVQNWPGKRTCQKGLVCGPDPKTKRGETGGNYICL